MAEPDVGDEVLVDVSAYQPGLGEQWCRVVQTLYGAATPYPVRVEIPGAGIGQFRTSECIDRRPA